MTKAENFLVAWENYKANRGKTRTLAGLYWMAVAAEKERPGCSAEFIEVWNNRDALRRAGKI